MSPTILAKTIPLILFLIYFQKNYGAPLPCGHNAVTDSLKPVVHHVRNYQAVNRRVTGEVAVNSGLISEKEDQEIRGAVGSLVCPPDYNNEGTTSTAFLFENKDEIVTAAHAFGETVKSRDISKCYFQNFATPPERQYLMASHARNKLPIGLNTKSNRGLGDKARLKLQKPIGTAKPLTLDADDQVPYGGTDAIVVMAQNRDMPSHIGPIYSPCKIMMLQASSKGNRVASDCDADTGGSGGVFLVRDKDGLSAKALLVQMSHPLDKKRLPDHSSFNESTNASYGLVMDKKFFGESR